jgi:hypothetical protein
VRVAPLYLLGAAVAIFAIGGPHQAEAAPIDFSISTCVSEGSTCSGFDLSGGGSVDATVDVVGGLLEIAIENNLLAQAWNDDPHIKNLGFGYQGTITGLSLVYFDDTKPFVGTPRFYTSGGVTSIMVDFGFDFPNSNGGDAPRFEVGEAVLLRLAFDGSVNLDNLLFGAAQVGGLGNNGAISATLQNPPTPVPEPGTLLLLGSALVAGLGRRYRLLA